MNGNGISLHGKLREEQKSERGKRELGRPGDAGAREKILSRAAECGTAPAPPARGLSGNFLRSSPS